MIQDVNWDRLFTKWDRDVFLSVNVVDQLPFNENKEEYFETFIDSCVPLTLWSRNQNV